MPKQYVTVSTAAQRLNVTVNWVSKLIHRGELHAFSFGARLAIEETDLLDYMQRREASKTVNTHGRGGPGKARK